MNHSANLGLPYLLPNQAQKHVTLNEALRRLDAIVQIRVERRDLSVPPTPAAEGSRYIPAKAASGAWAGKSGTIACFQDGGWIFMAPQTGWLIYVTEEDALLIRKEAGWEEVAAGSLNPAARIGINATADDTNRLTVSSPASLFGHAGAGHQLKLNKATEVDTASLLFQTDYTSKAELGLTGSDQFELKVSSDGSSFTSAMAFNAVTGFAGLGTPAPASRLHVQQDFDARLTIDTVQSGAGGGFDILNSTDGQNWRVTGSPANFKIRDHSALIDKLILNPGVTGSAYLLNISNFGIGTSSPTTRLHVDGPVRVGSFLKASLPSPASAGAGAVIFVSDEAGGSVLAFSDGTNWRRVTDRVTVS